MSKRQLTFLQMMVKNRYLVRQKGHPLNPLRKVKVDSFRIAVHETTNREFEQFVKATNYQTDAERNQNALVFEPGLEEFRWMNGKYACNFFNSVDIGSTNIHASFSNQGFRVVRP